MVMRPCHLCASVGLTRLRTFPAWITWGAALGLHSSPKGAPGAAAIPRSGPLGESDKEEVPGSGWLGTGLNPRPGRSLEAAPDLDAGRGGRKARGAGMPAGREAHVGSSLSGPVTGSGGGMCRRRRARNFAAIRPARSRLYRQQRQLSKSNLMLIASVLNKMRGQITSVLDKW